MRLEGQDGRTPAENGGACGISGQAFRAYLVEYKECMEGYRHAVSTIWQAGAVVAAISGGLLAFGLKDASPTSNNGYLIEFLALLPLIVWCFGLYWPMNHYAELKCDRLAEIEAFLSAHIQDLEMKHFRGYRERRRGDEELGTLLRSSWRRICKRDLFPPRVAQVVAICGTMLSAIEVAFLARLAFS